MNHHFVRRVSASGRWPGRPLGRARRRTNARPAADCRSGPEAQGPGTSARANVARGEGPVLRSWDPARAVVTRSARPAKVLTTVSVRSARIIGRCRRLRATEGPPLRARRDGRDCVFRRTGPGAARAAARLTTELEAVDVRSPRRPHLGGPRRRGPARRGARTGGPHPRGGVGDLRRSVRCGRTRSSVRQPHCTGRDNGARQPRREHGDFLARRWHARRCAASACQHPSDSKAPGRASVRRRARGRALPDQPRCGTVRPQAGQRTRRVRPAQSTRRRTLRRIMRLTPGAKGNVVVMRSRRTARSPAPG